MKTIINIFVLLVISGIIFYSCKREKVDTETDSADDENLANQLYFATFAEAGNQAISVDEVGVYKKKLSGKPDTIYIDTTINNLCPHIYGKFVPDTGYADVTIDYGTDGCLCKDGKVRKGKIKLIKTGFWFNESDSIADCTSISVELLAPFYTDNIQMEGKLSIVYHDPATFNLTVTGAKIYTQPNPIQWNCNFTFKEIQKDNIQTSENEQIVLTSGWTNGVTKNGHSYNCEITSPLRKEGTCKWIVSGTFELTPQNKPTRIIDYGDGTCDNIATLTVEGVTVQFILN